MRVKYEDERAAVRYLSGMQLESLECAGSLTGPIGRNPIETTKFEADVLFLVKYCDWVR
jgi:hypothetical protein